MSEETVAQCICSRCSGLRMENAKLRGACKHMAACRALLGVPDDEVLYVAIESLRAENVALRDFIRRVGEALELTPSMDTWTIGREAKELLKGGR